MPRGVPNSAPPVEQLRLLPDAIGIPEIIEQMDYQIGEVQRMLERMYDAQEKLRSMIDNKGLYIATFTEPKTVHAGLSLTLKL